MHTKRNEMMDRRIARLTFLLKFTLLFGMLYTAATGTCYIWLIASGKEIAGAWAMAAFLWSMFAYFTWRAEVNMTYPCAKCKAEKAPKELDLVSVGGKSQVVCKGGCKKEKAQ